MARRAALISKKVKKPRVSRSESYLINFKYMGDEPSIVTKSNYINSLNWYSYMCTVSDAREYLETYLKNQAREKEMKILKRISDSWIPLTAAWIARMISRGVELPKESREFLEKSLKHAYTKAAVEKKEVETESTKISIQDRIREKGSDIIAEIEGMIDDNKNISLYEWLKSNQISAIYSPIIIAKYTPILDELIKASEGKDEQLNEGYRCYNKKQLKELILFYNSLIEDAERYSDTTKKVRKPRKPRTISVEKKLKYLKYQKEDNNFKIASVNPEKVIGCQELWTFNTKYKTMTVMRAIDRGGLQIKGTSIIGYDEKNSITKRTGRKPEYFIDKVLNGGKIILRKLMDEMKNESSLAYRINENTILLKVI